MLFLLLRLPCCCCCPCGCCCCCSCCCCFRCGCCCCGCCCCWWCWCCWCCSCCWCCWCCRRWCYYYFYYFFFFVIMLPGPRTGHESQNPVPTSLLPSAGSQAQCPPPRCPAPALWREPAKLRHQAKRRANVFRHPWRRIRPKSEALNLKERKCFLNDSLLAWACLEQEMHI